MGAVKAGFAYTGKGISAQKRTPQRQWGRRRGRAGALEASHPFNNSIYSSKLTPSA
jgi:hypothetical protein